MSKIVYKVLKHDGAWAYEMNGTYSEKFPTRESARKAAKLAASEQAIPGDTAAITFEGSEVEVQWHNEIAGGHDRPKATAEG